MAVPLNLQDAKAHGYLLAVAIIEAILQYNQLNLLFIMEQQPVQKQANALPQILNGVGVLFFLASFITLGAVLIENYYELEPLMYAGVVVGVLSGFLFLSLSVIVKACQKYIDKD